jgi:predicted metal-dependent phosphoesterase TrpH
MMDGIEGVNAMLSKASNLKAIDLATSFDKPIFGGSDAHSTAGIGHVLTCSRANNYREFLDNLTVGDSFVMGRKNRVYPSRSRKALSGTG